MGVNVAYPGRDGAHSAAACDSLFPTGTELVPLPSFTAVVAATAEGEVAFGVLPIESSLTGPVNETHDLLYESPLSITGETVLPIRHCLVGPKEVPLEEIKIVRSHPAALDQCRRLLAAMPWTMAIASATTADAASEVSERGDPTEAAIASERAARMYGLTVIAGDVGDHPEAYTRFVSVAPYTRIDREGESWLVTETLAEVQGLTRELRVFGSYPAYT
jgi:prephenate dehydratase